MIDLALYLPQSALNLMLILQLLLYYSVFIPTEARYQSISVRESWEFIAIIGIVMFNTHKR